MNKSALILTASLLAAGAAIPATMADTTIVDLALGNAHSADFNDDSMYASSPVPPPPPRPAPSSTWNWGAFAAPAPAGTGWATNTAGLYKANDCGGIMSPAIDLTGATSASASISHWYHTELNYDGGNIFVTTDGGQTFTRLSPTPAYGGTGLLTTARACLDGAAVGQKGVTGPTSSSTPPAAVFSSMSVDLTAFAGQTVRVVYGFGSDASVQRSGWYVNSFATTINGVTTTETFDAGDGGFTVIGTKVAPVGAFGWKHGVPTSGPLATDAMWGTNMGGLYGLGECAWIESAPFTIGPAPNEANAVVNAALSWQQWFRGSSSATAGVVQIGDGVAYTNLVPTTGYGGNPTGAGLNACTDHTTQASGAFTGLMNTAGSAMVDYEADVTPWVGKTVTVRFLFASTATATRYDGWYVDNVNVDYNLLVSVPDAEDLIPDEIDGGSDAPLWTHNGTTTWAFGLVMSGPGVNQTAYDTNPAGLYSNSECGYIQSPTIPAAIFAANPSLTFDQWYNIENKYDGGVIMASSDGGATWAYVSLPEYDNTPNTAANNCLVSLGVPSASMMFTNTQTTMESIVADLSAFAGAGDVAVRFVFTTDTSVVRDGWTVNNVALGGVDVL